MKKCNLSKKETYIIEENFYFIQIYIFIIFSNHEALDVARQDLPSTLSANI
jgi:hypothetical protein